MLLCDCVQAYFRIYLMQQRGYGPHTIASYRDTFKLLLSYLDESGTNISSVEMSSLDSVTVTAFLSWLETSRGNSTSTRNVRLAHIRSFASFIAATSPEDAGACASISVVPMKKQTNKPPDSLSRDEVKCLLGQPGTYTKAGLRDSAMLALLYDSACRVQELVDMDVSDVVTKKPCSVSVVGKGRKGRRIPLLPETGMLISAYIDAFRLPLESPLFINRSGNRLTRAGVSNVVERHWRMTVMTHPDLTSHSKVKPHLLRHSKATHLVEENVNIYYIRDFLGHSSVSTTQMYLKTNLERMREAVETAASGSIGVNNDFYTLDKKAELMAFLETLA